jgi:DNA modification methylase
VTVRILTGDCRDVLATLPDASVHCCVTSPPYFGLRDYGCAGQIGLEPTPTEFAGKLVAVFREVRRVLRDDGTLWLNLGDSYATRSSSTRAEGGAGIGDNERRRTGAPPAGLKNKDLVGIPWRVAFALQADGWYLRQDIVWHKPNAMPESVQDRCTKAHEYVFLLSKSQRYFFDAAAMQEPAAATNEHDATGRTKQRLAGNVRPAKGQTAYEAGEDLHRTKAGLLAYAARQKSRSNSFAREAKDSDGQHGQKPQHRAGREDIDYAGTRNKRSVWTIATMPFAEAHFATMAPALAETCIRAGCPAGGVVLDPFGGAGTTGLVADRLQRDALLIDLNPAYAEMAHRRIAGDAPLFAEVLA